MAAVVEAAGRRVNRRIVLAVVVDAVEAMAAINLTHATAAARDEMQKS